MDRREFMMLAGMFGVGAAVSPRSVLGAEQRITQTQEENLKKYGYPWDGVYFNKKDEPAGTTRHIEHGFRSEEWVEVYKKNNLREVFEYPTKMDELIERLTDGKIINGELQVIGISDNDYLVFGIKTEDNPSKDSNGNLVGYYTAFVRLSKDKAIKIRKIAEEYRSKHPYK